MFTYWFIGYYVNKWIVWLSYDTGTNYSLDPNIEISQIKLTKYHGIIYKYLVQIILTGPAHNREKE